MTATDGPLAISVSFKVYAQPDALQVVSGPADGAYEGGPAAVPFTVRVTAPGGASVAGHTVTVSVTAGTATLAACGAASCVLTVDGTGTVSTMVSLSKSTEPVPR